MRSDEKPKPKLPPEKSQIWQHIAEDKKQQERLFNNFAEDFIAHLRSETLDVSTWFILTEQIKDWFQRLGTKERNYFAKNLKINPDEFFANIADPEKFHHYCERLSQHDILALMGSFLKFKLRDNFLQRERAKEHPSNSHIMKDIYAMMSHALGIKLYFVDRQLKTTEYSPVSKLINTTSLSPAVRAYLSGGPIPYTQLRRFTGEGRPDVVDSKELVIKTEVKEITDSDTGVTTRSNFLTIYWEEKGSIVSKTLKDVPDDIIKMLPEKISSDKELIALIATKGGSIKLKEDKEASDVSALLKAQAYLPSKDSKGKMDRTFKVNLDAKGIKDEQVPIELNKLLAVRDALKAGAKWDTTHREALKFWFPDDQPNLWPSSDKDALEIIEFAIRQMHALSSFRFGRFMAGDYPKNIESALNVFDTTVRVSEEKKAPLSTRERSHTRAIELNSFSANGAPQKISPNKELIREFHYRFKKMDCPLIEDANIRDALLALYDELLIIASKEYLIKGERSKRFLQIKDALFELNNMAALLKNKSLDHASILKDSLEKVEHVCNEIKPSYFMAKINKNKGALRKSLDKNKQALKSAIRKEKAPDYFLIKAKNDPNLFERVVRVEAKDPSQGQKPGGIYTMEGSDHQQRMFMIKRGGGVGETFAEYISWQQFLKAHKDQKDIHAAVTHLVVEKKEGGYDSIEDFAKHIFVASEYTDAYYSNDAHKVAGFEKRPKMAGTMHRDLCGMLIELNAELKLGLEHVTAHAMQTLDKDLHTGNIRLVADIKPIKDQFNHLKAMGLSDQLKKEIKNYYQKTPKTDADKIAYLKKLKGIITDLKSLGALVYFHKIDHGFAYFHADEPVNYNSSALVKSREIPVTVNPLMEDAGFKVRFVPTNHISEFTAHSNANALVLSDAACDMLLAPNAQPEEQLQQLDDALTSAFADLKKAALEYTPKGKTLKPEELKIEQEKAEVYILKAFYKHATGRTYRGTEDIQDIQKDLRKFLKQARNAQIASEERYYLSKLKKLGFEDRDAGKREAAQEKFPKQYELYLVLTGATAATKDFKESEGLSTRRTTSS